MPESRPRSAERPKVSILLVNWNRFDDIQFALASIRQADYANTEIIVIDNGSEDGSADKLALEPDVTLVRLQRNGGPSEARNAGVAAASGKYVFLLDSDAIVARDTLKVLVDRMEGEPDLGILGCRVLNWYSRRIDQWVYAQPYATHGNRPFDTYAFTAAGALIRADVLKIVGGFWERLFIYNEEVDYAMRVIRAGYRVGYEPDAHVLHRPSKNGRATHSTYYQYQVRNWIWIYYRHYPFFARWKKIGVYSAMYAIKGVLGRHPMGAAKGIFAGLTGRDVIREFPDKMSRAEVKHYESLNRGRGMRIRRPRTGLESEPFTDIDLPPRLVTPNESVDTAMPAEATA